MRDLIEYHAKRAYRGNAYNALRNCHVRGLHSVVLHEGSQGMVRVYIASSDHQLHYNNPATDYKFSLAVHSHHCDIQFVGLYGEASHDTYALTPTPHGDFAAMAYQSAITGAAGGLTPIGPRAYLNLLKRTDMMSKPHARAHELHTVSMKPGGVAAWIVLEGEEDGEYNPTCWTNNEEPFDTTGMYIPMDSEAVGAMLARVYDNMGKV